MPLRFLAVWLGALVERRWSILLVLFGAVGAVTFWWGWSLDKPLPAFGAAVAVGIVVRELLFVHLEGGYAEGEEPPCPEPGALTG